MKPRRCVCCRQLVDQDNLSQDNPNICVSCFEADWNAQKRGVEVESVLVCLPVSSENQIPGPAGGPASITLELSDFSEAELSLTDYLQAEMAAKKIAAAAATQEVTALERKLSALYQEAAKN